MTAIRWPYILFAGTLLGAAYAASPVTLWFGLALVGLLRWVGHDLTPRERRWVQGRDLLTAAALRVLTVAVLFLLSDHHRSVSFFWDFDGVYLKQRAFWIRNVWLGICRSRPSNLANAWELGYGWTDYLNLLAYIQYLVGPAPYGVHLFNVAVFLATAVLLYRMTRPVYGREAAFVGFAVLLFLPTPFAWSVSALKESVFVGALALSVAGFVAVVRGRGSCPVRLDSSRSCSRSGRLRGCESAAD